MTREELIEQARSLLKRVGMDEERYNDRSVLTLLALVCMDESSDWKEATGDMHTVRDLMDWMRDRLDTDYAPNTRETIRRQTLHQFIAGGIVEYNSDDPDRATNSPKNNYRVAPELLEVIRLTGTPSYGDALAEFNRHIVSWRSQQHEDRGMNRMAVTLPDGSAVDLSAGGQNKLIKSMVEEFCPRYTPAGQVVYIDDADKRQDKHDHPVLEQFGISIPEHGKAPDLIVWMPDREWLFLMEACSTHGPIDVLRKRDLNELFAGARGHIVFVSCFPDRATMRKYLVDLAWETEAWCADDPDHMIHLDGERFLGPYGCDV